MKIEFSVQIFEKYYNFMKALPLGARLFQKDGRRDRLE